jgi:enoyl-CoA hydratase
MSVRSERAGRVVTIVLDRPEARNAVDPETARALCDALLDFDRDDTADVAVFFGAQGAFCAGADLKAVSETGGRGWIDRLPFPDDLAAPSQGPMGPSRLELSKPVIAAVAGPAVAGGTELALWCDIRVMEEDAYFGIYCRRWGVPLIDGGTVRLPRLVGEGRALEIILTGRKVTAQEALAIGMCERVVPKGEARAAAETLAQEIARFPQACVRADRASVRRGWGMPMREALRQEFENGLACLEAEGIAGAGRFASGKGRHGDFDAL